MPDLITVTGVVATTPRHVTTNSGLEITSFRLASTQRRYDRDQKKWVDGETNWYSVSGFRHLALNLVGSLQVGHPLVVSGRLRIRTWDNGERTGTSVEIEADAVGHDLARGTAVFTRVLANPGPPGAPTATDAVAGPAEAVSVAAVPGGDVDAAGWAAPGLGGSLNGLTGAFDPAALPGVDGHDHDDTGNATDDEGPEGVSEPFDPAEKSDDAALLPF